MGETIVRNLPKKTGHTLDEWIELLDVEAPAGRHQRIEWLSTEHGLGPFTAAVIVERAERDSNGDGAAAGAPTTEAVIAAQYAGLREKLRPILDRLVAAAEELGDDVAVSPRQTYVTLSRTRVFALVQPSTRHRVDLGLALAGHPYTDRLRPAGSLGGERITHKVGLTSPAAVDADVLAWLAEAYQAGDTD